MSFQLSLVDVICWYGKRYARAAILVKVFKKGERRVASWRDGRRRRKSEKYWSMKSSTWEKTLIKGVTLLWKTFNRDITKSNIECKRLHTSWPNKNNGTGRREKQTQDEKDGQRYCKALTGGKVSGRGAGPIDTSRTEGRTEWTWKVWHCGRREVSLAVSGGDGDVCTLSRRVHGGAHLGCAGALSPSLKFPLLILMRSFTCIHVLPARVARGGDMPGSPPAPPIFYLRASRPRWPLCSLCLLRRSVCSSSAVAVDREGGNGSCLERKEWTEDHGTQDDKCISISREGMWIMRMTFVWNKLMVRARKTINAPHRQWLLGSNVNLNKKRVSTHWNIFFVVCVKEMLPRYLFLWTAYDMFSLS